jgi:hypothetical protein
VIGRRLQEAGRRLWRWLFPPEVELPAGARRVIAALLPGLDLGRVSFHLGMPHLAGRTGSVAITLPAPLTRRVRIYVDPHHWDPGGPEGLGTLIHEAYHALQAQESGWRWGPFQPFLILYFAAGAANRFRYRGHPMEEAAYHLAGRPGSRFESTFAAWQDDFAALEEPCCDLAAPVSGLLFWRDLARSIPFVRRLAAAEPLPLAIAALLLPLPVAVWLLLWSGATMIAWLARLLFEGAGAVAAGTIWGLGSFVSMLSRRFSPSRP